jgi:hypothetical protein
MQRGRVITFLQGTPSVKGMDGIHIFIPGCCDATFKKAHRLEEMD